MSRTLLSVLVGITLSGCAGSGPRLEEIPESKMQAYLADKPDATRKYHERILLEGERNRTLNHMRAGLASFENNNLKLAKYNFDEAIQQIETIYANNASAKAARSKFKAERVKDFKGEAYERAMAFYYRGLIDLIDGDFENARASFLSGQLQDSMAEQSTYASDLASLEWLAGWAAMCKANEQGGSGSFRSISKGHFKRARELDNGLKQPAYGNNLLVVVESGTSPVKTHDEKGVEYIRYQRGTQANRPILRAGAEHIDIVQAEDLYWQASTRGGRQVDMINAGKAEFRDKANQVASAATGVAKGSFAASLTLLDVQSATGYSDELMNATGVVAAVGLVGSLISGISSLTANATKPEADIRYWDNLPDKLFLASLRSNYSPDKLTYAIGSGKPVEVSIVGGSEETCSLGWARTHSALSVPATHVNAL